MGESYSRNRGSANPVHRCSLSADRTSKNAHFLILSLAKRVSKNYHGPELSWTQPSGTAHLHREDPFMSAQTKRHARYWRLTAILLLLLAFPRAGLPQSSGLQKLFSDYYEF